MAESFEVISPVHGRLLHRRSYADGPQIESALALAEQAYSDWRYSELDERIQLIRRFLSALTTRRNELADLLSWQIGRPRWQADEVDRLILNAEKLIETAEAVLRPAEIECGDGVRRFMERIPLGVCLSICAWNYPVAMASSQIIAPILAGNTVLFKHAPQTAEIADFFNEAFASSECPSGVFQALDMTHGDVAKLLKSKRIQIVQFIGSNRGGEAVATVAGASFPKLCLELGGNDPAYIRPDVSLEQAINELVEGSFGNAGQSCCSVERIYVHREIYNDFLAAFSTAAQEQVTIGDPFLESPFIGPVVSSHAANRIGKLCQDAVSGGARELLRSAEAKELGPAYVLPQILADANHDSPIVREEIFGPVVPVIPVDSDDEAVTLMNDTEYGLTASIWTQDVERGLELGRRIESGTFYVNRCDHADLNLTWGGVKRSGIGRSYGEAGFDDVTTWRSYHLRPLETGGVEQ